MTNESQGVSTDTANKPMLDTMGKSRNLLTSAFGSHITALQMLSHLTWGSTAYRSLADLLRASDGRSPIISVYEQWLASVHAHLAEDLQPIHVGAVPLVLVDGEIHRGHWTVHSETLSDDVTLTSMVQLINNETSARVAEIITMRQGNPNAGNDAPAVVGYTTPTAVQGNAQERRGDYSPLLISATVLPILGTHPDIGIFDLITIDNVEEPPSPEKSMATQLTYMAVTEWVYDRQEKLRAKTTN